MQRSRISKIDNDLNETEQKYKEFKIRKCWTKYRSHDGRVKSIVFVILKKNRMHMHSMKKNEMNVINMLIRLESGLLETKESSS